MRMRLRLRDLGGDAWIAGSIYVQNLATALAELDEAADLSVTIELRATDPAVGSAMRGVSDRVVRPGSLDRIMRGLARRTGRSLPRRIWNPDDADVVYPEQDGANGAPGWAAWIPDAQHLRLPDLFTPEERRFRDRAFERVVRWAPVVVVSSRAVADDLTEFFPSLEPRLRVLHFASTIPDEVFAGDPSDTVRAYDLPRTYVLVSNQFWEHKDHETIVNALGELRDRGASIPAVVCTGDTKDHRNPGYFPRLVQLIERRGVAEQIRILGSIPRIDQLRMMRASAAVLQPSRFEGWSTVIEDARALGRPVIASDIPVHREQDPPGLVTFRVGDASALATELERADALPPGPDPEAEAAARAESANRRRAFGRGFLEIAREVALSPSDAGG